jgi:hypothetical protein
LTSAFERAQIPLGWLPVAVTMYLVRRVVQAPDSPRSGAGWGSVLRTLAVSPETWADELNASNTLHLRPPDRHVRPPPHLSFRKGPSSS